MYSSLSRGWSHMLSCLLCYFPHRYIMPLTRSQFRSHLLAYTFSIPSRLLVMFCSPSLCRFLLSFPPLTAEDPVPPTWIRPGACCPQVFGWRRYLHPKPRYSTTTWRLRRWITTPTLRSGGGAERCKEFLYTSTVLLLLEIRLNVYIVSVYCTI